MKINCGVIRDLLPLYADDACSEESRLLVDEHLRECPECTGVLERLRASEIEDDLRNEKGDVIRYGAKKFRKQSAAMGSAFSGVFLIPILIALAVNMLTGSGAGWFYIMLAAMAVAASLILVPILVPKDKAFWTFCAFCVSLLLLLGVTCLVSGGSWFGIAASASVFGLAVCFLPFVVKAKPLQPWIGKTNKVLLVLGVDLALFLNMMNVIRMSSSRGGSFLMTAGSVAAAALVVLELTRKGKIGG